MSVRERVWVTRKGETKSAWVVDYSNGAGEREHRTFARKKEADAFHHKVKVDIRAGTHVAIDNDITIADVADKQRPTGVNAERSGSIGNMPTFTS